NAEKKESKLHPRRRADVGAGHRREHRDLFPHQRTVAPSVARQESGAARAGRRSVSRRRSAARPALPDRPRGKKSDRRATRLRSRADERLQYRERGTVAPIRTRDRAAAVAWRVGIVEVVEQYAGPPVTPAIERLEHLPVEQRLTDLAEERS